MAGFTVIATQSSRIKDLPIVNGQLVFVQDKGRIAFDFNDKRVFYNQITELDMEYERSTLESPSSGYYFIIETAVLWYYGDGGWVQITSEPENILFVGVELPQLGQPNKLYVNSAEKEISVWDESTNGYVVVSDRTNEVTDSDIESLFD